MMPANGKQYGTFNDDWNERELIGASIRPLYDREGFYDTTTPMNEPFPNHTEQFLRESFAWCA